MVCLITVNNKEVGLAIEELQSIKYEDGLIIINDIVELKPEEIVELKIQKGVDKMNEEKIIRDSKERSKMTEKVEEIIKKYKNVEMIGLSHNMTYKDICFELYDFLDKPGNFEVDIECIIHEIQPVVPTEFTISQELFSDEYWDGEKMTDSNLSCFLKIKYVGDSQ